MLIATFHLTRFYRLLISERAAADRRCPGARDRARKATLGGWRRDRTNRQRFGFRTSAAGVTDDVLSIERKGSGTLVTREYDALHALLDEVAEQLRFRGQFTLEMTNRVFATGAITEQAQIENLIDATYAEQRPSLQLADDPYDEY